MTKPMKLISIFIHEMGHASAAWITGGKVDKVEVYSNEGGVTNFRGGFRPCVIRKFFFMEIHLHYIIL